MLRLNQWQRRVLAAASFVNLMGGVLFLPPLAPLRALVGLPTADPFYLWLVSAWILGFGVAFALQSRSGQASRGVLALAAWGKAMFVLLLLAHALAGQIGWLAVGAGLPDLVLAAVFVWWLRPGHGAEPAP